MNRHRERRTCLTNKDLKKLRRADLLEILVEQGRKIDELETQLTTANKELEDRRIALSETGSIAEAALKLNKVFEDAEKAAQQYVENVAMRAKDGKAVPARPRPAEADEETKKKSEQLMVATARKCKAMEEATAKKCLEMIEAAKREAAQYGYQDTQN